MKNTSATSTHLDLTDRFSSLKLDSTQIAGNISYNTSSQPTQVKIGPSGTYQTTENYSFDAQTGLLTGQSATMNGSTLIDLSYDYGRYSSAGNASGKTGQLSKITNNLNSAKNREYQFDALGRLSVAKGKASSQWTQNYSYDRYGNKTGTSASGTAADSSAIPVDGLASLSFDAANNRISSSGWSYDGAGNIKRGLAEDGTTWLKYEYDAANRVKAIKIDDANQTLLHAYQYGSTNQRLIDYDPTITGHNTFYIAVGGTVLAEYTEYTANNLSWTRTYSYLGSRQLSTITPNGTSSETTVYNHPDRLGTKVITNQLSGASYEQAHLPFGTALNAESTITTNNKRFTTYDRSPATGLDYAVNRYYSPAESRFTQVDPIGMASASVGNPQSNNLYSYVQNMPTDFVDPSGLLMVERRRCRNYTQYFYTDGHFDSSVEYEICSIYYEWVDDVGFGGVGGSTRDDSKPKNCLDFANAVEDLYKRYYSLDAGAIVQKLYNRFAARSNEFSSEGFEEAFRDDNQARHYIGGLYAGTEVGSTLALAAMNAREINISSNGLGIFSAPIILPQTASQKADTALNAVSTKHGGGLKDGSIHPRDLADLIRKEVCD